MLHSTFIDRDEFCLGETTFLAVDVGGHEQGMFHQRPGYILRVLINPLQKDVGTNDHLWKFQ